VLYKGVVTTASFKRHICLLQPLNVQHSQSACPPQPQSLKKAHPAPAHLSCLLFLLLLEPLLLLSLSLDSQVRCSTAQTYASQPGCDTTAAGQACRTCASCSWERACVSNPKCSSLSCHSYLLLLGFVHCLELLPQLVLFLLLVVIPCATSTLEGGDIPVGCIDLDLRLQAGINRRLGYSVVISQTQACGSAVVGSITTSTVKSCWRHCSNQPRLCWVLILMVKSRLLLPPHLGCSVLEEG
jgi:hypothetical protein